ncbi:MAG: dienelactone hydrolase family protein, partial [Alphaproteobacteria bacterium]|nr:dienelactone hydrolase family protein [Alphaproteobacteria bacterium]
MRPFALLAAFVLVLGAAAAPAASLTIESVDIPSLAAGPRDRPPPPLLPGILYMPPAATPIAAMIVAVSSGCVVQAREPYYARALAREGIAGLVLDSCAPRGVASTVDDQTRLTGWEVEQDAWAALAFLARDPRIDPARIGVMGVSKGGGAALGTALLVRRRWLGDRRPDVAFAAHVPIVPGCTARHRDARTTGAPILFMLGGADDYAPAAACLPYAEAIRAAGNGRVDVKLYEGAHHGWEVQGDAPRLLPRAENYSRCGTIVEDDGAHTAVATGERIAPRAFFAWARQ